VARVYNVKMGVWGGGIWGPLGGKYILAISGPRCYVYSWYWTQLAFAADVTADGWVALMLA